MKLYVDIEFTDRSNQFYEKFSTRAHVGLLLEMLWNMPSHRCLLCCCTHLLTCNLMSTVEAC